MRSFFKTSTLRSVLLSSLLATFTWPLTAEAVNRYVSDTGTDGISGTKTCTSAASPCLTISYAVGKAAAGDTIWVTYGSTSSPDVNNVTINKHLNITGLGATRAILNTNGANRHFTVNAGKLVTLTNLDLRDGVATSGGSIFNYGLLTLLNCQMSGNTTTYSHGGAIYNSTTGTLVVNNSLIKLNSATQNGGAIYNSGTVRVSSGSSIASSTAQYGGGIYTTGGNANVQINQNSTVTYNSAHFDGGGVYVDEGSTVQISDSSVGRNNAEGEGGGVYAGGGNVTVTKSTFEDNNADQAGGAVSIHSGTVTATTSLFIANDGGSLGGAIRTADTGLYSITHSSFEGNFATIGGAIGDATLTQPLNRSINGSTFVANTADDGGAIFFTPDYALMSIVNSTFSQNFADNRGGAIFNSSGNSSGNPLGGGTVNIANVTFYGNAAGFNSTAGATIWNERRITMNNSIVTHSENSSTPTLNDGTACGGTALPLAGYNNHVGTSISTAAGYATVTESSCGPFPSFTLPSVTYFDTVLGDNGGADVGVTNEPLQTHELWATITGDVSNAAGAGWNFCPDPTTGAALTVDQRNQPRPGGAVAGCDVGAYELQ